MVLSHYKSTAIHIQRGLSDIYLRVEGEGGGSGSGGGGGVGGGEGGGEGGGDGGGDDGGDGGGDGGGGNVLQKTKRCQEL